MIKISNLKRWFNRKTRKQLVNSIPLTLSMCLGIFLIWTMVCKLSDNREYVTILSENRVDVMTISGFVAGLIIAYLTAKVLQIRQEKITRLPELMDVSQKLHNCRRVMDKLIHSNIWPDGVRHIVDTEYKGFTYFELRQTVFVGSITTERARAFIEDKRCGGPAKLYLELKSFMFGHIPFDQTLYTEFNVPKRYHPNLVEKWIDYDCGNGLWTYFEHKYAVYKDSFNFHDVYSGDVEAIEEACLRIDKERYTDIKFGADLLAKMGVQLTGDILPELFRIQRIVHSDLPRIIKYLFVIAGLLIVFGIALPILNNIYSLSPYLDIISIGIIISISFYLVLSFYGFMKKEVQV